jgi:NTP pyrophosphatase (non-canonical NTP hydrolase)
MKEKLLKIINNYGVNHQQRKLEEEIFELQEAITQKEYPALAKDKKPEQLKEIEKQHLEEEFADCMVVLEQFKAYYNLDNDKIVDIMYKKIERQLNRIENENI